MKLTLPIFFAAALAASSSAEAASFSFTKAEISEAKMISNGFFYLYEAAGVITHNNKDYDTTVALECEGNDGFTELLCEGELDVIGYTADVELVYSDSKGVIYWATSAASSTMRTAAELWVDQVIFNVVVESSDNPVAGVITTAAVNDGQWQGFPYTKSITGQMIYYWVHSDWLDSDYVMPTLTD